MTEPGMEDRIENESELLAWIEGEATPDQEARVSAQLARDPQLSRLAHELRADRALLQQLGEVEPPADLLADAQMRLERSLLLDGPDGDGAAVLAAPMPSHARRGRRWGAWGSVAAVFLVAITLGITWRLGVFRTGPTSPPVGPGSNTMAREDRPKLAEEGAAMDLAERAPAGRDRGAGRAPDVELERGAAASGEAVVEGMVAGQDLHDAVAVDAEKGTGGADTLLAFDTDAEALEQPPTPAEEAVDDPSLLGARMAGLEVEAVDAAEVEAFADTVLVWAGEVAMAVEPELLQDRAFQQNLVIQMSNDPQEFVRRNAVQMRARVHQQRLSLPPEPAEVTPQHDAARRGEDGGDASDGARGRETAEEVKLALDDDPGSVESPQPAAAPLTDLEQPPDDYGLVMMQSPGGELYELEVSMRQLPEYVDLLNTPTQSAWLEFDALGRARYQAARHRLLASRSLFWWRQEAWDASRTRTIYRVDLLPPELVDQEQAAPAEEPEASTGERPR